MALGITCAVSLCGRLLEMATSKSTAAAMRALGLPLQWAAALFRQDGSRLVWSFTSPGKMSLPSNILISG